MPIMGGLITAIRDKGTQFWGLYTKRQVEKLGTYALTYQKLGRQYKKRLLFGRNQKGVWGWKWLIF